MTGEKPEMARRNAGRAGRRPAERSATEAEVEITALGARGDGIGRLDGKTVFVPFAAPGDRLRIRLEGEREGGLLGRIVARLVDGASRTPPACRHFADCGGCALQHLDASGYRDWKQGMLRDVLARRGISAQPAPIVVVPPASRRRAVLAAERDGDRVRLGFNAATSRRIVDLEACPVLLPELARLLDPLRAVLAVVLEPRERADLALTATDSGIDLWLQSRRELPLAARQALVEVAEQQDLARISIGPGAEPLILRRQPRILFGGVPVALPPGAFLQATSEGEAALAGAVLAALAGRTRIADLFAGCGTFTLPLAARARVHAVEGDGPALAALAAASRALDGRVTTERRDLARAPLTAAELDRFEAVVFDPPRVGARELALEIGRSRLRLAVAVSCNPSSFARDARILLDAGFRLETLLPVDQFLWSPHLELVASFSR
jgi:23S rRNA (uracil1939-C5)-methyltransferase